MSKFMKAVRKSYLEKRESIAKSEYDKAKAELPAEDFEKIYHMEESYGQQTYYKTSNPDLKDEELPLFMQIKIYDQLVQQNKSLRVIKGIAITFLVLTGLGILFTFTQAFTVIS